MPLPSSFYLGVYGDNTEKPDGTPETGSFRVPITTVTAANYTAVQTALNDLQGALNAITIGDLQRTVTESSIFNTANPIPSTNPLAQRENKYLLRYHDSINGQKFRVSIPTADLSVHMTNSEFIDLASGAGANLKTFFEAVVVSPNDASHPVVLDSAQFVGRNS